MSLHHFHLLDRISIHDVPVSREDYSEYDTGRRTFVTMWLGEDAEPMTEFGQIVRVGDVHLGDLLQVLLDPADRPDWVRDDNDHRRNFRPVLHMIVGLFSSPSFAPGAIVASVQRVAIATTG